MRLVTIAAMTATASALAALVACSSSNDEATPAETQSDPDASVPDADAAPFAAAAHAALPQVVNLGGPVLANPKIVPIFFAGFDHRADVLAFAPKLAASTYWKTTTGEYGVGALAVGAPIDVAEPPPGLLYNSDIRAWLESRFDGTHPEFGTTPIDGAIYTLYYPTGVSIYDTDAPDSGAEAGTGTAHLSCDSFGGYHGEATVGGASVAYAVIAHCTTGIDFMTEISSHEWVEAATDPIVKSRPAYARLDDDHVIWGIETGSEVGDLCEREPDAVVKPADIGYVVQRTWSNAAAMAGTEPCVPAPSAPFIGAAPLLKDDIDLGTTTSKGAYVPAGTTKTFEVDLFSSAPTDDWVVKATAFDLDKAGALVKSVNLFVTLTPSSGNNGDKLQLEIRADKGSPFGFAVVAIDSSGPTKRRWWALVGN